MSRSNWSFTIECPRRVSGTGSLAVDSREMSPYEIGRPDWWPSIDAACRKSDVRPSGRCS